MFDSMITRARQSGTPLIDGRTVTLLWQGQTAPCLIDDSHNWEESPQEMTKVEDGLWTYTLTLPRDAYLEYAFFDPGTKTRVPDPLNRRRVWNGINAYNHYFYMPEGGPTRLIRPGRGIARGTVSRHEVETRTLAVGEKRLVYLYQPPASEPVPLLVVYDGMDYLRRGRLAVIADNLIAQKRIRPIAMALVQNAKQARMVEYGCSDIPLAFLLEIILPLAKQNLDLLDVEKHPGAYGVLGASMGGLMALYTGLRLPQVFGKVLSQSGAFELWGHETVTMNMVRHMPKPEIDIWMDVGKLEWLLPCNQVMHALLREKGYRLTYREFSGGHNYTSWRNDIWRGLELLFGNEG